MAYLLKQVFSRTTFVYHKKIVWERYKTYPVPTYTSNGRTIMKVMQFQLIGSLCVHVGWARLVLNCVGGGSLTQKSWLSTNGDVLK